MGGHFDIDSKLNEIKNIELELQKEENYQDLNKKNELNVKIQNLKKSTTKYQELSNHILTNIELLDLLTEDDNEVKEIENNLENIKQQIELLEIETYLNGKYDDLPCYLEIHPGAGGTEAHDWANMLLRMYEMFCDKNNYKYEVLDLQKNDEAGINSVTLKIDGYYPYGYFKSEQGVHRLVRISPFDSNSRRHTSFAAVSIIPVIKQNKEIEIKPDDIRVDVYRSSGKGGQGVNTTDSAVRITHLKTGIVVTCQNERSQIKNKEIAMNILTSKLISLMEKNHEQNIDNLKNHLNIEFGSQIRNYTLEPYKLVKDVRTNYEDYNADGVLNGNIIGFMESYLKEEKWKNI